MKIILIGGFPRSGTSLLLRLFDNYPNAYVYEKEINQYINSPIETIDFDVEEFHQKLINPIKHKIIVLKNPLSENILIPLLKKYKTQIYFIYMIRNPLSVFSSYKRHPSKIMNKYDSKLFCKQYYKSIKIFSWIESKTNSSIKINYESLVKDSFLIMSNLTNFLNIQFNKSLLDPTINGKKAISNSTQKLKSFDISNKNINVYNINENEISYINFYLLQKLKNIKLYYFITIYFQKFRILVQLKKNFFLLYLKSKFTLFKNIL